MRATISASVVPSRQRTGDSSTAARSSGPGRASVGRGADAADLHDVADDVDADLGEQVLGVGADDDAGGGLARGGSLQGVADVVVAVLEGAGEVGVTGARPRESLPATGGADLVDVVARFGVHRVDPLGPLGVVDHDRDRGAERGAVADAAEDLDAVLFEGHAR
jgi:hypothetical protein